MYWKNLDLDFIKKLTKQVVGKLTPEDGEMISPYKIKGQGAIYCYCPRDRTFVKLFRGAEVLIISYTLDDKDRVLAYSQGSVIAIDPGELEEVGFN